jgi:hypothetical protein
MLRILIVGLGLASAPACVASSQGESVSATATAEHPIELDGRLVAVHRHDETGPYLWPLLDPLGREVTRAYPMEEGRAGEATDHPHHRSLWFAHGDINGHDFWHGKHTRITTDSIDIEQSSPGSTTATSTHRWTTPDETLLTEARTWRFRSTSLGTRIDATLELTAASGDVRFGDTKEGTFAVRLAPSLRLVGEVAEGSAVNANGDLDGDVWGQRTRWIRYSGPLPGDAEEPASVAVFDHPDNPRSPTWWHARDYGLLAANPFGMHDFTGWREADASYLLPAGETLSLRYRLLLSAGEPSAEELELEWRHFAKLEQGHAWQAVGPFTEADLENDWSFSAPDEWSLLPEEGAALHWQSAKTYQPPHRSPHTIGLLHKHRWGSFELTARVAQASPDEPHRDLCLIFGYQDPAHFYYVHLAPRPDPHACNIFKVDDAARTALAAVPTEGVDWGDPDQRPRPWRDVTLQRDADSGLIRVTVGDWTLEATDTTFDSGYVGVGTFDNAGALQRLEIRGVAVFPDTNEARPRFGGQEHPMTLTESDQVWNRACLQDGGVQPSRGDRALADMLVAHGLVMNGGVHHAVNCLSLEELAAAVAGYEYFRLPEVASFLAALPTDPDLGEWTEQSEFKANERYDKLVPSDEYLSTKFERVFRERSGDFASITELP